MSYPKVYIIRHGETLWSISGQHTGTTDIPLTENGLAYMRKRALALIGDKKLIRPATISRVLVSPRKRAQQTSELLFSHVKGELAHTTETCDDIVEWNYGAYEGLKTSQILEKNPDWLIWTDGCPDGESVKEMEQRVDRVINDITTFHEDYVARRNKGEDLPGGGDIVLITHGHFSRCFLARWAKQPIPVAASFIVNTGAVSLCGYERDVFERPKIMALNMGMGIDDDD